MISVGAMERAFAPSTIARASGCSLNRSSPARQGEQFRVLPGRNGDDSIQGRLPDRESSRLVDHQRVDLTQRLDGFSRFGTARPAARAAAAATMIEIGVARPSAQGHAMISTATAFTSAYAKSRLRSCEPPDYERENRERNDRRYKPQGNVVRQTLQRSATALGLGNERHDLREEAFRADTLRNDDHGASLIQGRAHDTITGPLIDG